MPGMLDRAEQIANEIRTTKQYGKEIDAMQPADKAAALIDLLPGLVKAVDLPALQDVNEKTRQWIDAHPQP